MDKKSWYFTEEIINSNFIQGSLTNNDGDFSDIFPPIYVPTSPSNHQILFFPFSLNVYAGYVVAGSSCVIKVPVD